MEEIRDRVALVTGAAKRVGARICMGLAGAGVHVAFTYRSSAREAAGTLSEIQGQGVKGLAVEADLTDLEACRRVIEQVREGLGPVDILVNNASIFPRTPLEDLAGEEELFERRFDQLFQLHMRAPLYLGMGLGLDMKRRGWGRIVNITDRVVARAQAYPRWSLYLGTKYGLHGLTQALAVELAPEVQVNSIAPGLVLPPPDFSRDEVEELRERIPLGREAGPDEIAGDILFLVRSRAKTGTVLVTDGGSGATTF